MCRWKESFSWILMQFMPEMELELEIDNIRDLQKCSTTGLPNVLDFLLLLDKSGTIPIASNPHSIFAFHHWSVQYNKHKFGVGQQILSESTHYFHPKKQCLKLTSEQLPHPYQLIC